MITPEQEEVLDEVQAEILDANQAPLYKHIDHNQLQINAIFGLSCPAQVNPTQPVEEKPECLPDQSPLEPRTIYTIDYPDLQLLYEKKRDAEKAEKLRALSDRPETTEQTVDLSELFESDPTQSGGQLPSAAEQSQIQTDEHNYYGQPPSATEPNSEPNVAGQPPATTDRVESPFVECNRQPQTQIKTEAPSATKEPPAEAPARTTAGEAPKTRPSMSVSKLLVLRSIQSSAAYGPSGGGCPTRLNVMKMEKSLLQGEGTDTSKLMYYFDRTSRTNYLVDSGSRVSVIPAAVGDKPDRNAKFKLVAAGGSGIQTYGTQLVSIRIGNRYLKWTFVKAAVNEPIIGIDFIRAHRLIIDPFANRLVTRDNESIECSGPASTTAPCLSIDVTDPILKMLEDSPELTDESIPSKNSPNVMHFIRTDPSGKPPSAGVRHYNPAIQTVIKETFRKYLRLGYVRYSDSHWSSPLAVVKKPSGEYRVCGDYRQLNSITLPNSYPLPYLPAFNNRMRGCRVFSKMDLSRAYHQIRVFPADVYKTAVLTPAGLFEFVRMPFGLRTAGCTLQKFMDSIFADLDEFVYVYCDDIVVFSEDETEHRRHLALVFAKLREHGLKINVAKSEFNRNELEFLGHHLDEFGVTPSHRKVRAILDLPIPNTIGQVRRYLGMITYYANHIANFAALRKPLNSFLNLPKSQKQNRVQLDHDQIKAFYSLNKALADAALLYHPDPNAELIIHSDSSSDAVGGVLHQVNAAAGQLEPLFFYSKLLPDEPASKSRPIFFKELEAAYMTVKRVAKFLEGQHTTLYVDNEALYRALSNPKEQSAMVVRRMIFISQYVDEIRLVSGRDNVVADALSRTHCNTLQINSLILRPQIDYSALVDEQSRDESLRNMSEDEHLKRKTKEIDDKNRRVWVHEGNDLKDRFYVPAAQIPIVIAACHELYHPGVKGTTREVAQRFFWPQLKRDVRRFVKHCVDCQQAKASRMNEVPPARISPTDRRFQQVHIDLVSLPVCGANGASHVMTMIDRHTRYLVVEPVADQTTLTVWRTFKNSWVKYFGVPARLTSDRGKQFTNPLFHYLANNSGIKVNHTTAFSPQPNGIVEREHSKLKNSLRAFRDPDWSDRLAILVLAWNNAVRSDFMRSPAQLLYGTNSNLPIDFFERPPTNEEPINSAIADAYVSELEAFRCPKTCLHAQRYQPFVHRSLRDCSHVWIRNETRRGLEMTYVGPFKVLGRSEKYFTVERRTVHKNGTVRVESDHVSIRRIKPAFLLNSDMI